jgi:VIT1/CCC1 family predicted Fe2+/Mn2+ transporter
VQRGLEPALAQQVAQQMMSFDALAAHKRDDIGISNDLSPRPITAALTSSASFATGALGPLLAGFCASPSSLIANAVAVSLAMLCVLGATSARLGGASLLRGTLRILAWGVVAMGATGLVGRLFGAIA